MAVKLIWTERIWDWFTDWLVDCFVECLVCSLQITVLTYRQREREKDDGGIG